MPSRPSVPTRSRNFRQAARIARKLAASSDPLSSFPISSLSRCRISITEWTQCEGTSISLGSYSTRRSSRKAITRRAVPTSISAGCHDAPPNGVEMPVRRLAISENFIGLSFHLHHWEFPLLNPAKSSLNLLQNRVCLRNRHLSPILLSQLFDEPVQFGNILLAIRSNVRRLQFEHVF